MEHQAPEIEVKPVNKAKVKNFLKVMWYLAAITAVEFAIAFTVPPEQKYIRVIVFIVLTLVKAYYIVAEFMHLGHEKKSLRMSIVLPLLFVVFLIFILVYQGQAIYDVLY